MRRRAARCWTNSTISTVRWRCRCWPWQAIAPDISPVQAWLQRDDATLQYTRSMLAEILTQNADYPIASVAVRRLAQLAQVPVG